MLIAIIVNDEVSFTEDKNLEINLNGNTKDKNDNDGNNVELISYDDLLTEGCLYGDIPCGYIRVSDGIVQVTEDDIELIIEVKVT